jgi:tetratricopeptide (TPR) repeat protein
MLYYSLSIACIFSICCVLVGIGLFPLATVLATSHTHHHKYEQHSNGYNGLNVTRGRSQDFVAGYKAGHSGEEVLSSSLRNKTSDYLSGYRAGFLDENDGGDVCWDLWDTILPDKPLPPELQFPCWEINKEGLNQYGSGNYTEAIKYYDKALAIKPNYVAALNNKGLALSGLGNYTGAIKYYDKALAKNPDYVEGLNNKGLALYALGNYTGAIKYYDKALAKNPNYVNSLNNKGNALIKLGRNKEAIATYGEALNATFPHKGIVITQSYTVSEDHFRIFGVADIISGQQASGNDSQAKILTNVGYGYKTSHPPSYFFAVFYFDKALQVDPHYYFALWNMADTLQYKDPEAYQYLQSEHKDTEAYQYLSRAYEADPHSTYKGGPIDSPAIDTGEECTGLFRHNLAATC